MIRFEDDVKLIGFSKPVDDDNNPCVNYDDAIIELEIEFSKEYRSEFFIYNDLLEFLLSNNIRQFRGSCLEYGKFRVPVKEFAKWCCLSAGQVVARLGSLPVSDMVKFKLFL